MRTFTVLLAILFSACGGAPRPPLVATDVVVTAPMPGTGMSAAYLSLQNNSNQTINISRVTSAQYASVQLHESTIEDGIARMRAVPELEIPAGKTVTLQRGGKHLMLMRPTGSAATVSLQFFDDNALVLSVETTIKSKTKDNDDKR
ncbi:MAG: copper chaperone PCu(A)C [Gammaproteobacteria bacterium]|nr:copper chaperone PCu(A)C [Gammaproteobacteria bacterium]